MDTEPHDHTPEPVPPGGAAASDGQVGRPRPRRVMPGHAAHAVPTTRPPEPPISVPPPAGAPAVSEGPPGEETAGSSPSPGRGQRATPAPATRPPATGSTAVAEGRPGSDSLPSAPALPSSASVQERRGRFPSVVRVPRSIDVDLEHMPNVPRREATGGITGWLYQREETAHHQARPWYKVLCLTGVDYFSTLGYQPGIAYLAAGLLSPVATLILVLFTLVAALPVYSRVAKESPHGQGSIAMLERLLSRWKGKLFVLCLLGFAATDFVITITLSAADATAHIVENPFVPEALRHSTAADISLTLVLIAILAAVFLKGFKEAIGVAVVLVVVFLSLNLIVVVESLVEAGRHPDVFDTWQQGLRLEHGDIWTMLGVSLLIFPKLALGLSGFETGVAVMPLVKGNADDTEHNPAGRIRNTRKLLATSALIMSSYLLMSSLATTLLIPAAEFEAGGQANGRALAYLAHDHFGDLFGTIYDLSTIAILWFAGASAMAGLLNLVPRYLPGYGMAPQWASAQRPLVLVFTIIAFVVTLIFRADVEAQGSAYATGVLVLMTSGATAVTISAWRRRSRLAWGYVAILLAFVYITVQNVHERPSGLVIASFFILAIVATSITSRVMRSTELRIHHVLMDRSVDAIIRGAIGADGLHLATHDPRRGTAQEDYDKEVDDARRLHHVPADHQILILEVTGGDPSVFADRLLVTGHTVGTHKLLRCAGPAIPNAIAALALAIRGQYACIVHLNMRWTPIPSFGEAVAEGVEFLLWGEGDTARIVELEIRRASPVDGGIVVHAA